MNGVSIGKISPARRAAFDVLKRVSEGAYASDSLRERTRLLEGRDASLASQIVFGCLRYQGQLDHLILRYSGHCADQMDPAVSIALRMAIFQFRYLERVPPYAVVNESVELVKQHQRAASSLVNAVLRKVNREPVTWPDLETELSCPSWLLKRWADQFGFDQARQIAEAALKQPSLYIRVAAGSPAPESAQLAVTDVKGCFRLLSPLTPGIRLHDISSQSIIPLMDLQPGHSYLDLCAAPGNKTLQALETPLAVAIACDISWKRIREVSAGCSRVVLDATCPLPFNRKFDRIFIDAPCSGTGTLARNPEIKWRVKPQDLTRFGEKQRLILSEAAQLLASGGKLLYATCSLEREENEDAVCGFLARHQTLHLAREWRRLPGRDEGDGFYAAVLS